MKMTITPMKIGNHYEPCMLSFANGTFPYDMYPSAIVHIDTFHQGRNAENAIYNLLLKGKIVIMDIDLTRWECKE